MPAHFFKVVFQLPSTQFGCKLKNKLQSAQKLLEVKKCGAQTQLRVSQALVRHFGFTRIRGDCHYISRRTAVYRCIQLAYSSSMKLLNRLNFSFVSLLSFSAEITPIALSVGKGL